MSLYIHISIFSSCEVETEKVGEEGVLFPHFSVFLFILCSLCTLHHE